MEELKGDTRVFCVMNTTEYNNDGQWCVQCCDIFQLGELGFDAEAIELIDGINVGGMLDQFDETGVIVVRIA